MSLTPWFDGLRLTAKLASGLSFKFHFCGETRYFRDPAPAAAKMKFEGQTSGRELGKLETTLAYGLGGVLPRGAGWLRLARVRLDRGGPSSTIDVASFPSLCKRRRIMVRALQTETEVANMVRNKRVRNSKTVV
jgi:hypothetical protein